MLASIQENRIPSASESRVSCVPPVFQFLIPSRVTDAVPQSPGRHWGRAANKGEFETEVIVTASFAAMPSDSHSYLFSFPGF